MKKIIFIQSKLPINYETFRQVTLRWEKYGEILQSQDGSGDIWLFTASPRNENLKHLSEISHIKHFTSVESESSVFKRLHALQKEIMTCGTRATLVCGDNQQSLLVGLYLKLRLGSLVGVQIQFHGDTYSFSVNRGLKGFVRVLLSRLGIVFADSIRIVSKFQEKEIKSIWQNASNKFVLAPIPIELSKIAKFHSSNKYDLAFIGRLHSERGINELIEIIKKLKSIRPATSIAIAGDGPLREYIADELSKWVDDSSVSLLGFLDDSGITNLYSETKVLVSTAPREGYGLTLREAILSNVHVIAQKSEGALEAKAAYPDGIHTFTTVQQAVELILIKLDQDAQPRNPRLLENQIQSDQGAMKRLIGSWLTV